MEIKYNVQAPPKNQFHGGSKSEEVKAIEDFLTSGNAKNMCFQYESAKAANRAVMVALLSVQVQREEPERV